MVPGKIERKCGVSFIEIGSVGVVLFELSDFLCVNSFVNRLNSCGGNKYNCIIFL